MIKRAPATVVVPAGTRSRTIVVAVIEPGTAPTRLVLVGDDGERFAQIRQLVGGELTRLTIDDQDGPAAVGWIDVNAARRRLAANQIATELADRAVAGPMVVTGAGRGDSESMTSVHAGLQSVLERMVAEVGR